MSRTSLMISGLLIAVAVWVGPFGTYESHSLGERLAYWSAVVVLSNVLGRLLDVLGQVVFPNASQWVHDAVIVGGMALFFTPPLHALTNALVKLETSADPSYPRMVFYVIAMSVAVCLCRRLLPWAPDASDAAQGPSEAGALTDGARILRRLPNGAQGAILRLCARDHFVDVVTERGVHSLRMRLGDAVAEMDGVPGFVTHRSHWVAAAAIREVNRANGRTRLLLHNGDAVPVSRSYKPELERSGVL